MTSTSRLTGSPTPLRPKVVSPSVVGMSETVNQSSPTAATVRLTASTFTATVSATSRDSSGAGRHRARAGAGQRLGHEVDRERGAVVLDDGEADAVHGDGGTVHRVGGDERATDGESGRVAPGVEPDDLTQLLDDSGEHQRCTSS